MNSVIRTRFAPSPTGTPESVHLGFVIRALWSYAFAKKNNGQFVLRMEDTDQKRSRKDTEEEIYTILKKFGINWDEGPDIGGPYAPYRQSQRLDKYQTAAKILVEKGYAYYDFDAPHREKDEIEAAYSDGEKLKELKIRPGARSGNLLQAQDRISKGEPYVVRIKIPQDRVFEYDDWILKKKVRFRGVEVPDMILLKSDGFPTYHLAVVVDDLDMQISHIFRGQEWISSTPIHLYIYEGLGKKVPVIGHFSVILDPRTGKKFSKRDMTALFGVNSWLQKGYLPQAILNYLMLLGWAPKDNREIFSLGEFVNFFDQSGVQKANPTFDTKKLDWFNGYYIRQKSNTDLTALLKPLFPAFVDESLISQVVPLVKERMTRLDEVVPLVTFLWEKPRVSVDKFISADWSAHLHEALTTLEPLANWNLETINPLLTQIPPKFGWKTGDFFMSLRLAVSGNRITPPINDCLVILGKQETISRLTAAIGLQSKSN